MSEPLIVNLGEHATGTACETGTWSGRKPRKHKPPLPIVGTVEAVYPELPDVADIRDASTGILWTCRDLVKI
jgi:hypothetical protein